MIEVRRVWGEKNELDSRGFQILPNGFGTVVTRIITDDVNANGKNVQLLKLLEQSDRRLGVDGVVEAHDGLEAVKVLAPLMLRRL